MRFLLVQLHQADLSVAQAAQEALGLVTDTDMTPVPTMKLERILELGFPGFHFKVWLQAEDISVVWFRNQESNLRWQFDTQKYTYEKMLEEISDVMLDMIDTGHIKPGPLKKARIE